MSMHLMVLMLTVGLAADATPGGATDCRQGSDRTNDPGWSTFAEDDVADFAGCGELAVAPQGCVQLLTDDGAAYIVENTGGFFPGARVFVSGVVDADSDMCAPHTGPAIVDNTIGACFDACGELEVGPYGCMTFRTESGDTYYLENWGDFWPGAQVYVTGRVDEMSFTCYPHVGFGIEDNTIAACYNGCGVLLFGPQDCPVLLGDDGEWYFVEDAGEFTEGERIHVTGPVSDTSLLCDPMEGKAIERNDVEVCTGG